MKNYSFKPGWLPSVCVVLLLPLFVSLGVWQLRRADEKLALTALRQQQENAPPIHLTHTEPVPERYRRVIVTGTYDSEHQFLLDNQVFNGQVGYHVLTPLRIDGTSLAILVNRGWVSAGRDRSKKPDLVIQQPRVTIRGIADRFPQLGLKLKGAEIPTPGWPALVQVVNHEVLGERLGYRLSSYQVLLDAKEAEGYERAGRTVSLSPDKNQAYALQWFSFAFVLLALYVWYGYKPKTPP